MTETASELTELFDDHYLYFFEDQLEDMSDADADRIWSLLELEPGMAVLDLGCGHGRIANRLARRGCRVTGYDLSRRFLHRARQTAHAWGVAVDYVHGDLRELPWTGTFDRIVNWGNAFGFFDDAGDRAVLALVAGALRPRGRFVIETNNYPAFVRDFEPSFTRQRGADLLVDVHDLDPVTSRSLATRIVHRDGELRREHSSRRLYTIPELDERLRTAGFATVDVHGRDGEPPTLEDRRIAVVARF